MTQCSENEIEIGRPGLLDAVEDQGGDEDVEDERDGEEAAFEC